MLGNHYAQGFFLGLVEIAFSGRQLDAAGWVRFVIGDEAFLDRKRGDAGATAVVRSTQGCTAARLHGTPNVAAEPARPRVAAIAIGRV